MNSQPRVFAVVLAAGESRRFGETKQLATVDGDALVERAAQRAATACGDRSVLVAGHDARRVIAAAGDRCRFLLVNDRYGEGMGTSVALAAKALSGVADALLIVLADQPLVTAEHLSSLIDSWSGDDDEIVASRFDGISGPPLLLPKKTFDDLRSLTGDQGAKALLSDDRFRMTAIDCAAAGVDIDTPEDLERLH
ncbi:MAG: nucleotidyltransferase family protein [Woeseiaceae bacterium]|nr:nucleotidyltransferase family protein [Woeseiaceae bacterium]